MSRALFSRRYVLVAVSALCALVGVLMLGAPAASAAKGVVSLFGGTGTAGGQLTTPGGVAVNDTSGNVYVVDSGNNRVQELSAGGAFIRAWGWSVVSTGATGTGTLADSSTSVTAVLTTSKAFLVGETITGAGIQAGSTIKAVGAGTITLSQATTATAAGSGVALTVAEGAGNVPVNAQQTVTLGSNTTGGSFTLTYTTPTPSSSTGTATIPYNAPATGAGSVQEALEDLANIGAGNVAVTGSAGGPWTIEFKGTRFADTNVTLMTASATNLTVSSGTKTATVATTREGAGAFEVCSEAASCVKGVASASAGGMSTPEGVAVEQVTGSVYVTDQTNHRVDEFTEAGAFVRAFGLNVGGSGVNVCTSTCVAGASGASAGEFGATIGYPAVDPTTGDVYVADPANRRVDEFEGDGVFVHAFGWGVVSNATKALQVCTTTCVAGLAGAEPGEFGTGAPTRVAVDAQGDVYAVDGANFRVQKFSSAGSLIAFEFGSAQLLGTTAATAPTDVAVEPTLGSVLAAREPVAEDLVYELDGGGDLLGTYAEGAKLPAPKGLAVGSSGESVYLSTATSNRVFVLGATVAPTATVEAATDPTASEATLHGTITPNETPPNGVETTWQFEYSTNKTEWTLATAGKVAASTSPVAVTQTVGGLEGSTTYYVRLHAEKEFAAGSSTSPTTVEFTTAAAAPTISGETVSNVAATSATLSAEINPQHLDTSYHFEYDTTPYTTNASHGTSLPVPDADIGAGAGALAVSQHAQGLEPNTLYYYRLVATSAAGTVEGLDETFTTQGPGGPLTLLDGRQWELVSPAVKHGAGIIPQRREGDVIQASESGDAISYIASNPIELEPEGNSAPEASQIMARRAPGGGWVNRTLDTPNESIHPLPAGDGLEYQVFSEDLSRSIVQPYGTTPLAPSATTERAPYLRDEASCDEGSSSCFTPFLTREDTMPGAEWDPNPPDADPGLLLKVHFRGATRDLSHSVLSSQVKLLEGAGEPSMYSSVKEALYEFSADGQLQFVSVNAAGEPVTGEFAGPRNGISADGSRIIWKGGTSLLMRDMATEETLTIATGGTFQAANEDDSKIFYTVTQLSGKGLSEQRLWECEVLETAGKLECAATEIAPEMVGLMLGIDNAANTVYFVSTAALAGSAEAGKDNLYVAYLEGGTWESRFIAALSSEDSHNWGSYREMTAQVTPDGRYLAFMSDRSLTGYDNHDAVSGEPDQEVFLYDDQTGRLACASCDPTGARPDGMYLSGKDGTLVNSEENWSGNWVAATVPGWDNIELSDAQRPFRYLSDGGQVFFDSSDSLVPQDTNGQQDVYEYEPDGAGSCALVEGCVDLVSSGKAAQESVFLEASASGNDVFFITTSKLTSQDTDTAFDVYDAHVCTNAVPCTQIAVSPPPCNNGEACKPPQTPQPSIFGAPASATFSGTGDLKPTPAKKTKSAQKKRSGKNSAAKRRLRKQRRLRKKRRSQKSLKARRRGYEQARRKGHGRGR